MARPASVPPTRKPCAIMPVRSSAWADSARCCRAIRTMWNSIRRSRTTGIIAHGFLVGGTEAGRAIGVIGEHAGPAAAFESVAAKELRVAIRQVTVARHVEGAGAPVVERARFADQFLHQAVHTRSHQVFAEIVTDVAAGIADAVRI